MVGVELGLSRDEPGKGKAVKAIAAVLLACATLSAQAAGQTAANQTQSIDIPAGPLDRSIRELARQSGISIGSTIRGLSQYRTGRLRGNMTAGSTLRRLLAGTPFRAEVIGTWAFRIVRRDPVPETNPPAYSSPRRPPPQPPAPTIVVTASKQEFDYDAYPGGATVIQLESALPGTQSSGLENLLASLPITSATNLGSGRNKLFIRGVADSSFNGPTQSTIGLYFGDLRLIYSAPNPDLRLYDMERVELLEGPQGTLYGAGALGGVIRMTPARAAPGEWQVNGWAGGALLQDGASSYNFASLVNAPIGDRFAARLLGYHGRQGGYVDDTQRGETDVNRTRISGWRASARLEIAGGWTVDVDGIQQMLNTRDGQYAEPNIGPLARRSAIAQPFDNDIMGLGFTLNADLGSVRLVSATGRFRSDLDTVFDASGLSDSGGLLAFDEEREIRLTSHETRLASAPGTAIVWVAGGSFARNIDIRRQFFGDPNDDLPIRAEASNEITEFALFGETTFPLGHDFYATAAGRLVYTESFVEQIFSDGGEVDPQVNTWRFLPTAALSWRPRDGAVVYLRYQRGYRAGGISIDGQDEDSAVIRRFTADTLQTVELGGRATFVGILPIEIAATGFYTDWTDIQADQIDALGFPLTRNIGDGRIIGLTASASIRPTQNLRISGALFANDSRIRPAPDVAFGMVRRLPNVADIGVRLGAELSVPVSGTVDFEAAIAVDYAGESLLDLDPALQFEQGGFVEAQAAISLRSDHWTLSLEGANLTNSRGNSFAFGNPFTIRQTPQTTPARPREVRLSASVRF